MAPTVVLPRPLHDALPGQNLVCFWGPATVCVDGDAVDAWMPDDLTHAREGVALEGS